MFLMKGRGQLPVNRMVVVLLSYIDNNFIKTFKTKTLCNLYT